MHQLHTTGYEAHLGWKERAPKWGLTCGGEVCQGGVVVGDPVLVEAGEAGEAAVGGHEAAVAEAALVPAQHQLLLPAVTRQAQARLQGRACKYKNFYFIFFNLLMLVLDCTNCHPCQSFRVQVHSVLPTPHLNTHTAPTCQS